MRRSRSDSTAPSIAKDVVKTTATTGNSGQPRVDSSLPPTSISSAGIARRAYELFLARGGEHGQDVHDWLHAERELRRAQDRDVKETV